MSAVSIDAGGVQAAASNVVFDGFGQLGSGSINQIAITAVNGVSARNLQINITSLGAIRVCDPAVTDSADPRKC